MGQQIHVRDKTTYEFACKEIWRLFELNGFVRLEPYKTKRKLDKNALSHVWYAELSRQLREYSTHEYRLRCKLHHGVPIRRRDDTDFRQFYDTFLKPLDYETKLNAMNCIAVTSEFSDKQMTEYLNQIQMCYGPQGANLTSSKELII